MNIYKKINASLKNAKFLDTFMLFNAKLSYSNCTKHSESMAKYIEIIVLKFKTNAINIQKVVAICNKYFLTAYVLITIVNFF